MLLAPGEVFSMVETLGEIDGAHGYLPEYVIKGNKTIQEYGGGLCQTATTMFRATLKSGLKVVERRNHSYTVRYYYENGVPLDATIYSPKPDYRFENDTNHYILIQTRLEGTDLFYEIWGTQDGREAIYTTPVVISSKPAPATQYIDTPDLAPGQTRCTEHSHSGLTTSFTYTVKYADGTSNEDVFKSVYQPWQGICLRGIDPNATAEPEAVPQDAQVSQL